MKLLLLALALTLPLEAQTPDTPPAAYTSIQNLWPTQAPGATGTATTDIPKLYCYPAPGPGPHTAVIVLPGGGYTHLVFEKEGAAEARWLNQRGISAYVLQYRLSPSYMYPWPLADGQRAVRVVRAHAKEWSLNPNAIGVWGFSAGGHLVGYLATADPHGDARAFSEPTDVSKPTHWEADDIDKLSAHPDFAISSYGRLVLSPEIPGAFGMKTLLGDHPSPALLAAVNPIAHVTKTTSPTFIYATETDAAVNAQNATLFYNALQRAGVPAELHIFEQGPHGTGMGDKYPELAIWPTLLEHWLQLHHWLP